MTRLRVAATGKSLVVAAGLALVMALVLAMTA